jgi:hypothetical protein
MSYLEQLKSENTYQEEPPKAPKAAFGAFGGEGGRHFSEKKATSAVDINTDDGTPFTDAKTFQGEPAPAHIDLADDMLCFMAEQPGPAPENDILEAVGGDPTLARNILRRLAVDGICEALPGGRFGIPGYPRPPADLPSGCPLTGAPFPETGCAFSEKMLRRLLQTGALPLPGGRCPLRRLCRVATKP